MWACLTCSEKNEGEGDNCWNCGTSRYTRYNQPTPEPVSKTYTRNFSALDNFETQPSLPQTGLILSTTPTLQTHTITDYLNVVSGEAVIDANIVNDVMADLLGARGTVYERSVKEARHTALMKMVQKAIKLEPHAVVGIVYETQIVGTMLMVSCWGTAVRLKPILFSNVEGEM